MANQTNLPKVLNIATRNSPLALWQANHVRELCIKKFPEIEINIISMVSTGDIRLDGPLSVFGGKGLFTKELEAALINDKADIAVHSLKDVPISLDDDFILAGFLERENCSDVLLTKNNKKISSLNDLPKGSIIGTSSVRRKALLSKYYPQFKVKILRGNLGTRINKLDNGDYDAIILAYAGVKRLNLSNRIDLEFDTEQWIPAPGQGVVTIEIKKSNKWYEHIKEISNENSTITSLIERNLSFKVGGSCSMPLGCQAIYNKHSKQIKINSFIGTLSGSMFIDNSITINYDYHKDEFSEHFVDKITNQIINNFKLQDLHKLLDILKPEIEAYNKLKAK